ncbi:bifunctional riboflavin kinase/FAD synthetase [Neolewinella litorea]|uniref:Bifunctional riboflavin kinase/FMN adenylyltransferase n=1 Tax=Neolewinella litorea TaxID=2562452 RepID=A0A4S4NNB3_9BACT|nr:bifunctional riboflavin kinase/FAD synthetase [Neolewinella litorea]THH41332.1 bifunctional riboflavin kinase/FAD synthetase [Neolewinella litorea]
MQTHFRLADLPRFRRAVITIGSFDGVHRGHQQLLTRISRMAERRDGESVVITFDPHPRTVLRPDDNSLRLLTTTREKINFCAEQGIDHLVVIPFDRGFSQQSPTEYIENFLIKNFTPDRIVIGYDHRFGKDRAGGVDLLQYYAPTYGYEVVEIAAQEVDEITVSSTKIRRALQAGQVQKAANLMGRAYELTGTVVRGQQIGRTLDYPTANLQPDHPLKLVPAPGIYAVRAAFEGCIYDGMLYIGDRPVIGDGRGTTIELHLFDYSGDLYGETLTVSFIRYLRGEMALGGMDALRDQLVVDEADARRALEEERLASAVPDHDLPDTAIVILNYNGRDYLERYLSSVADNLTPTSRLIVADNASTDDSVAYLRSNHPAVEVIELTENLGYAAGYNVALQKVRAEVYVLLNSDVRVTPGWLEAVLPKFVDPTVGAVQPKVLAEHEPGCFEYAGASGGYLDFLGYPFCRGRVFGHMERDEGQYDCPAEIFWATGAAFFVRASAFHDLQGFEPEYFAHAEEIDLCWRLKRAGYRILVEPAATVYHVGGGTLAYDTPRKAYLNFRNTLVTSFKNEHTFRLIWWLPVRLLLDGAAALLFLFQGKLEHIYSILRAHLDFYRNLPRWIRRRVRRSQEIEACRVGPARTDAGRVADSIALHYFLLGHKRFSQVVIPQVEVEPRTAPTN